jgi:hypothetical protein
MLPRAPGEAGSQRWAWAWARSQAAARRGDQSTAAAAARTAPQVLPFASDETLDQLEQNITTMPAINDLLDMGASPQEITNMLLQGLGVAEGSTTITPRCAQAAALQACRAGARPAARRARAACCDDDACRGG